MTSGKCESENLDDSERQEALVEHDHFVLVRTFVHHVTASDKRATVIM